MHQYASIKKIYDFLGAIKPRFQEIFNCNMAFKDVSLPLKSSKHYSLGTDRVDGAAIKPRFQEMF